jgi:transglutaminase-like putative cysteine protease
VVTTPDRGSIAAALVYGASVLLVVGSAPAWCVALGLGCCAWRILTASGRIARPKPFRGLRFLLGAITAILVFAVAASFRTLNGLAAGTALLVVMGALKVLEARSRRDDAIVVAVGLFLLLAAALGGQALWRALLYLFVICGACAAFALIAHPGSALTARAALRLSVRALAMSIPLALACFLFFPRISGQFWTLQQGGMATTGLTDEMSPGSISELATEYDPAFRVRFTGEPPRRAALYWRGPVLNEFDGFTWRRAGPWVYRAAPLDMLGDPVRYRVTLEPTNQRWMFALDTVATSPSRGVFMSHDRQLTAPEPITSVVSYDAVSHLETRSNGPMTGLGRDYETRLPEDRNPRTLALAHEMRARAGSDAEYVRAVLDWFRSSGLEYTLEPGTTSIDSVDTTLFDSKRGFCGHFASAYATMMRAAGVPARIVTGYLGGEWNPVGGYYIVRQSEAHAWTEVWLNGQGWTRVDPTAVVAPERLQRGVYDMLANSLPATSTYLHNTSWLNRVTLLWDGLNQWWQERVVEFNLRAQFDLLRELGIDSPGWEHLGWAFALGMVLWIAWVALTLRRGVARVKPDRIGRAWLRATRKLARVAPPRTASEGPLDYAQRIAAARPDLAAPVKALAVRYARLRFGPAANAAEVASLEREVRRLAV